MIYGFTGTRALLPRHWPTVISKVGSLGEHDANRGEGDGLTFVTGLQFGLDTAAAGLCHEMYPAAHHVLVVPHAPCNTALADGLLPGVEVIRMPRPGRGSTYSAELRIAYHERDEKLVEIVAEGLPNAELIAFPLRMDRARSGTWKTIGIAERLHVPVDVTVLEPPRQGRLAV